MINYDSNFHIKYSKILFATCLLLLTTVVNAANPAATTVCSSQIIDTTKCDYVTDGIDDQIEINAALSERTGISVELTKGYFYVTDSINVGSRDTLFGQGRGTAILAPANFNQDIHLISLGISTKEQHVYNLFLDGNREARTSGNINGIYGRGVTRSRIESVIFWGFGPIGESNGVLFGGVPEHISITNSHFEWISDDALDINLCRYCAIIGNTFKNINDNAIDTEAGYYTSVIGNTFLNIRNSAIEIEDESGIDHSAYMTIVGNTIDTARWGILINAGRHSAISANTIRNTTYGIYLKSFANFHSTYNAINGNVIDNSTYGVTEVDSNQNFNSIIGNTFTPSVLTPITRNGVNSIVRNNLGYVTENSGSAEMINRQLSISVNHGLSTTPSVGDCMAVGAGNPNYDVGTLWINSFTASQFTVNIQNWPGKNGFKFGWTCSVH